MSLRYPPLPTSVPEIGPHFGTFAAGHPDNPSPRTTSFHQRVSSGGRQSGNPVIMKRKGSVGSLARPKGSVFLGYLRVGHDWEERIDYGPPVERRGSCEQVLCVKKAPGSTENSCYNVVKGGKNGGEARKEWGRNGVAPTRPTQESSQVSCPEAHPPPVHPGNAFSIDRLTTETNQRPVFVLFDRQDTQKNTEKQPKDTDFTVPGSTGAVSGPLVTLTPVAQPQRPSATSRMLSESHFLPGYRVHSSAATNQKKSSPSTPQPRSSVIDKRMDQLAKQDHSQKVRDRSLQRTRNVKSKVSLMLSCPAFYKAMSQKRVSGPTADLTAQLRQSFVTNNSRKLLVNRPKMDIADLLLQKGKILELKKEEMMRQSLPVFRPNADNPKPASKSPVRVPGNLDVFERLAVSTFVREARSNSRRLDDRRQSAYLPLKAAKASGRSTAPRTNMPPTSFENLNKITLKSQGSNRFFIFQPKFSEATQTAVPGSGQPVTPPPKPAGSRGVSVGDDSVYQKNKYWLMKREGKLAQIRKENEGKDLVGCTFRPEIGKRPTRDTSPGPGQVNKENRQLPSHAKFSLKTPDRYVDDILKTAGLFLRKGV